MVPSGVTPSRLLLSLSSEELFLFSIALLVRATEDILRVNVVYDNRGNK